MKRNFILSFISILGTKEVFLTLDSLGLSLTFDYVLRITLLDSQSACLFYNL